MSAHGIFRPPEHDNEPVRSYAPGSPERAALAAPPARDGERADLEIPLVIGGKDVHTGDDVRGGEPHRKAHVLADVAKGGAEHVEQAIDGRDAAHAEWSRMPWQERAAVFLRAAELLAGPWRTTLNAATMLNQSKTAHQAEIDAVCELIDFWRFNVDFLTRIYAEQPHLADRDVEPPGVPAARGLRLRGQPVQLHCIGGNLSSSPALMGCTVVWKPASTAALLRLLLHARSCRRRACPDGVINLVYGPGATIGNAALASPELSPASTSPARPRSSTACGRRSARTSARTRGYPRLVGETGGKDFILAHPSAEAEAVATAVVRGSFEYQGQKCSAASRLYVPSNIWPEVKERLVADVASIRMGDVADFENFMGAVIDANAFETHSRRDRRGALVGRRDRRRRLDGRLARATSCSPTVIDDRGQGLPAPARRALRPDRHRVRLRRDALGRHARARRRDARRTRSRARSSRPSARAIEEAHDALRYSAGNFYVNDKPTGAVVGQQPFGGSRASGTNDKAGSMWNLIRWVTPAHGQGDVRAADGLPLPVPCARLGTPLARASGRGEDP